MKKLKQQLWPVLLALLIYLCIRLIDDSYSDDFAWERPLGTNLIEVGTAILASLLTIQSIHLYLHYLEDKKLQDLKNFILKEFTGAALISIAIVNALVTPMAYFTDDGLRVYDIILINTIPLLFNLLYFAIVRGNRYLKFYVENQVKLQRLENDKLATELKFLKGQIHPHFLFNFLNTIYFQMDENIADTKKTIEQFSALLRYRLYDQDRQSSLQEEFDYLINYVELERLRHHSDFVIDLDLERPARNLSIYPLLLLPLVENAFKYAGGDKKRIAIKGRITQDGQLNFEVVNTKLEYSRGIKDSEGGIGLENLRRRLDLLYGSDACLQIADDQLFYKAMLTLQLHEN